MKKILFLSLILVIAFVFFSKDKDDFKDPPLVIEPLSPIKKNIESKPQVAEAPKQVFNKHIEFSKKKVKEIVKSSSLSEEELDLISNFKIKPNDIIKTVKKDQPEFLNSLAKGGADLKNCLKENLCGAKEEFKGEEYFDENNTYYHSQLQRMLQTASYASPSYIKKAFPLEDLTEYISSTGSNLLIKEAALDLMLKTGADSELILKQKEHFTDGSLASLHQKLFNRDPEAAKGSFVKTLNSSSINDTKDLLSLLSQFQFNEQEVKQSIFNLCRFSGHLTNWPAVERPLNIEIKRQAYSLNPKEICE